MSVAGWGAWLWQFWAIVLTTQILLGSLVEESRPSKQAMLEENDHASISWQKKNPKASANTLFHACTMFLEEAATRFKAQLMAQTLAQSV